MAQVGGDCKIADDNDGLSHPNDPKLILIGTNNIECLAGKGQEFIRFFQEFFSRYLFLCHLVPLSVYVSVC